MINKATLEIKNGYIVTVKLNPEFILSDMNYFDIEDQVVFINPDGSTNERKYPIRGVSNEEEALDVFHNTIPISLLEVFDIKAEPVFI